MKSLLLIINIAVLIASCSLMSNSDSELRKVSDGLETLLDELPQVDGFDTIKTVQQEFSHTEYNLTCYYARANVALGAPISAPEALDSYTGALAAQGWVLEKNQHQSTRVLSKGSNALIVINLGEPGVELKNEVDIEKLGQIYKGLIFIRLDYMLPPRAEC